MSVVTTFPIGAAADDQMVSRNSAPSYPPGTGTNRTTVGTSLTMMKTLGGDGLYYVRNILLRWDTSSIPDTATIVSARLRFYTDYQANADSRNFTGEWYAWDGTSDSDWSSTASSSAFSYALSGITDDAYNEVGLTSPASNISKTGYTHLRLHIDGGTPTGQNEISIAMFEDAVLNPPELEVTYIDSPVFVAKSEGSGTVNHGASVSATMPTGTAINDEMIAGFAFAGGTNVSITPPSGWSLIRRTDSTTVLGTATYRKDAGASEAGPYAFTFSLTGLASVKYAYVNATYEHPRGIPSVDVASGQANASSTSVSAPALTTVAGDSLLVFVGATYAGGTSGAAWTPPSGFLERADVASGASTGAGGATKNFYLMGGTLLNSYQPMQEDGTAPTDAAFATATGWIVGANAAGNYAELEPNVERARTVFNTTAVPTALGTGASANAFRIPSALSGSFAAGNWTLSAVLRSVTAAMATAQTARLRWRVYRSANADGTSATELTSGAVLSNTVGGTGNTTANHTARSATWNAPAITLANEYLFFACAIEVVANSGTGNTRDANFRQNSSSVVTTPTFSAPADVALEFAEAVQEAVGDSGSKTATAQNAAANIGQLISLSSPAEGVAEKTLDLLWNTRHYVDAGMGLAPAVGLAPSADLAPQSPSVDIYWDINVTDVAGNDYQADITDAVAIADTVIAVLGRARALNDTVTVADAANRLVAYQRPLNDTITIADTAARTAAYTRPVNDTVTAADSVSRTLTTLITRAITDAVTVADTLTRVQTHARSLNDPVVVADSASRAVARVRAINDVVAIADAVARSVGRLRTITDTVAVADSASRVLFTLIQRSITDAVTIADTISRTAAYNRPLTDAVTVADTANRLVAYQRPRNDTVTVADTATRGIGRTRALTDVVAMTDSAARTVGRSRTLADAVTIADSVVRTTVYARAINDALAVGDSALLSQLVYRLILDSLTVGDSAVAYKPPTDILFPQPRRMGNVKFSGRTARPKQRSRIAMARR